MQTLTNSSDSDLVENIQKNIKMNEMDDYDHNIENNEKDDKNDDSMNRVMKLLSEEQRIKVKNVLTDKEIYRNQIEKLTERIDRMKKGNMKENDKLIKKCLVLNENLLKLLLVLDGVYGNDEVRHFRKKLVVDLQEMIDSVDLLQEKVKNWEILKRERKKKVWKKREKKKNLENRETNWNS
jgi:hypothetical protein